MQKTKPRRLPGFLLCRLLGRLEQTFAGSGKVVMHELSRLYAFTRGNRFRDRFVLPENARQPGRLPFDRGAMKPHPDRDVILERFHCREKIAVLAARAIAR